MAPSSAARSGGSSPRVRGKLPFGIHIRDGRRLIPARAGKTPRPRPPPCSPRAHPRACGENPVCAVISTSCRGSSPRVRGKHTGRMSTSHATGLIPARAGKTRQRMGQWEGPRAHPRACGENRSTITARRRKLGSSPRVRGKRVGIVESAADFGLIPARAGKTPLPCPSRSGTWAHPRACGENSYTDLTAPTTAGSSPRVRGKLIEVERSTGDIGLIPARAGKTRRPGGRRSGVSAHPRACGENDVRRANGQEAVGSSPRVRGKLHAYRPDTTACRLIPARAGKTSG